MNEFNIYLDWCKKNGIDENNAQNLKLYFDLKQRLTFEANEVITIKDMQKLLGGVSYSLASKKIREVKSISDKLGISGKIHKLDWQIYLNSCGGAHANN